MTNRVVKQSFFTVRLVLAACFLMVVAGCAGKTHLVYDSRAFVKVDANVKVGKVEDIRPDDVEPSHIDARSFRLVEADQNIANYIADAVALEMRQMGISRRGAQICTIDVSLKHMFFTGKAGKSVDLDLTLGLTLKDPQGAVLQQRDLSAQNGFLDYGHVLVNAINSAIFQTVDTFFNEQAVQDSLRSGC